MRPAWIGMAALFALAPVASGTVYTACPNGSGNFATIQAAITAATNGDVIELCCDVPFTATGGNIDISFQGKAVTVRSACGNPSRCLIDLQYRSRAFNFTSGEGPSSILEGVTIVNASANTGPAAIECQGSSPTIRNCVIRDCGSTEVTGAMRCASGSSPILEGCLFLNDGVNSGGAGALSCVGNSNPIVTECIFRDNGATFGVGGVECISSSPTFVGCVFDENGVNQGGAGAMTLASGSNAILRNCTFYNNGATSGAGALFIDASSPTIENTIITFCSSDVLCAGGAVPTLSCCDIYGNWGGGDWTECIAAQYGVLGNFSMDPLFCDAANRDFGLTADSPCLPGNHPNGDECGLIGAVGEGCGGTLPTGACCFVDGSCVVLEHAACDDEDGAYQGDGTTCDPNPCEPTPVQQTSWGRVRASYR